MSEASQRAETGDIPNEAAYHLFRGSIFVLGQLQDDSLNAAGCSSQKVLQGILIVHNSL